jgi:hypothetical protein
VTRGDRGSAVVEFVFVAIVALVPLVYLIVAVAAVQRSQLAVTDAARAAGRAFATSDRASATALRVRTAVRLALAAQGLPDDAEIRFVPGAAACTSAQIVPSLAPGTVFRVCVVRHVAVPGVPNLLAGRAVTSVGAYVVHVDDFRTVAP